MVSSKKSVVVHNIKDVLMSNPVTTGVTKSTRRLRTQGHEDMDSKTFQNRLSHFIYVRIMNLINVRFSVIFVGGKTHLPDVNILKILNT